MTKSTYHRNGILIWEKEVETTPEQAKADAETAAKLRATIKAKRDERGRAAWLWLHSNAQNDSLTVERLAGEFLPMIPAYGCHCRKEANELLLKIPFRSHDQVQWAEDYHNGINLKLGKPLFNSKKDGQSG